MAAIKTSFARTKQMLLTKTGHSEETIDVEYHYEKERVFSVEERLAKLQKNTKKLNDLYKDLNEILTTIGADACDLYEPTDSLYNPSSKLKDIATGATSKLADLNENQSGTYTKPLVDYLSQHKEIKKRTEELTTRKVDMDRYKNEVGKLREKGAGSSAKTKLGPTEEKYRLCKEGYESLHIELVQDLPLLYEDKGPFTAYLLASLVKSQARFYNGMSEEWSAIPNLVEHIDEYKGRDHKPVITSVEKSSASINLRADPVFRDKGSIKTKSTPEYQTTNVDRDIHQPSNPSVINVKHTPNPYAQTKTAIALYDFAGQDSTELSFTNGDHLIIHKAEGEWWDAELRGIRGYVPANYVKLN